MLKERDLTVGQISDAFEISTPSISYHLDLLKHARLVSARKNGSSLLTRSKPPSSMILLAGFWT